MKITASREWKKGKEQGIPGILFCSTRIPETQRLVVGSSDFGVYEIDLSAEKVEPVRFEGTGHESYVTGIVRSGEQVVSGSYDGRLIWWDLAERRQVRTIDAHSRWIRQVAVTGDGQRIISVADDMMCRVWDASSGELLHAVTDHKPMTPNNYPSMLYAVAVSPDDRWLATGDKIGHVAVWDLRSLEKVGEVDAPQLYTWDPRQRRHSIGGLRSLAFSPDSSLLAAGGIGQIGNIDHLGAQARTEVFRWEKGETVHQLEDSQFKGLVEQIRFTPDGGTFLTTGGDHGGFLTAYETESGKAGFATKMPMHVHDLEINEDFTMLYAVGHERIATFELVPESEPEAEPEAESTSDVAGDAQKK